MILVERYSDKNNAEIKVYLPQGESFILASKIDEGRWEVSVQLPWYGRQFYTGIDSTVIYDGLHNKIWQEIMDAPTSDLIAIIRKALPVIRQHNHELNLEI